MAEGYLRQSPLASLGLAARAAAEPGSTGVRLGERDRVGLANLRGDASDALFLERARQAVGTTLPLAPNTVTEGGGHRVLWLGPNEWLIANEEGVSAAPALAQAVAGFHAVATDLSDARVALTLAGPKARDVIAKGSPLDLHPRVFGPMRCAQTRLAKIAIVIDQRDEAPRYDLYALRSQARYLWRWLEDAAREYGIAVVRG